MAVEGTLRSRRKHRLGEGARTLGLAHRDAQRMPFHTMPPSGIQVEDPSRLSRGWTPINDENVPVVAVDS